MMKLKAQYEKGYTPTIVWECPMLGCGGEFESADRLYRHLKDSNVQDSDIPKDLLGCVRPDTIQAYQDSSTSTSTTTHKRKSYYVVDLPSMGVDQQAAILRMSDFGWTLVTVDSGKAYFVKEYSTKGAHS